MSWKICQNSVLLEPYDVINKKPLLKQMCSLFSKLLIRGEWSALEEREGPQLDINIYKTFAENANVLTFEGKQREENYVMI